MISRHDIPPGSLVRFACEAYKRPHVDVHDGGKDRAAAIGILIAFDYFGRVNPDKGDPLVLWTGEKKPVRMVGSALEIVS